MKAAQILFKILIVYCALYSTIWLHEFGHAVFYFVYGCKSNLFQLHVPFSFAAASPGVLDTACCSSLTCVQHISAALGGILVNIVLAIGIYLVLPKCKLYPLVCLFAAAFLLSNLVEAASYVTLGNIFPMGDILAVKEYCPVLRIPLGIVGIGIIAFIARALQIIPKTMRVGMIIFTLATAFCMFGMRFLFAS